MKKRGDKQAEAKHETSMEDLIDSLSIMAEQNVILARGVQKKVETLRNVRVERIRQATAAEGA